MLKQLSDRFGLPTGALVVILALVLVQLGLQVYSLVDLAKRSRVPGGRKWAWAILIVAGNLVGVVIYLALGRPGLPVAADQAGSGSVEARRRALDRLYGRDRR